MQNHTISAQGRYGHTKTKQLYWIPVKTWSILHAVTSFVWQVLITARVYQEEMSYRINTVSFLTDSVYSRIFLSFSSTVVFDLNIEHDVTLPIFPHIYLINLKYFINNNITIKVHINLWNDTSNLVYRETATLAKTARKRFIYAIDITNCTTDYIIFYKYVATCFDQLKGHPQAIRTQKLKLQVLFWVKIRSQSYS